MIVKEIDPFSSQHDYEQAGQSALERVAYELKQSFSEHTIAKKLKATNLRVFSGLRFQEDSYALHINHLLVHSYGLILIENRAEPSDIKVNPLGEWTQIFREKELRISSPISQGERKLNYLKTKLEQNAPTLRAKVKKKQFGFEDLAFDLIVVVSDEGDLTAPQGYRMPQVCRIVEVSQRVVETLEKQRKQVQRPFAIGQRKEASLSTDEIFRVTAFLRKQHQALERESVQAEFSKEAKVDIADDIAEETPHEEVKREYYACSNCGCTQLNIDHQNGYRMMCLDCSNIMEIDRTCRHCGQQGFVSRTENDYFIECEACLMADLVFVDPVRT